MNRAAFKLLGKRTKERMLAGCCDGH
jgi:hypothetical protein